MSQIGFSYHTSDSAVGTSGDAVAVYGLHIISTGGGGAVINLRNGTSASATSLVKETGTVSTGKTIDFGGVGVVFPSGCFVDVDSNTTSVTVFYEKI